MARMTVVHTGRHGVSPLTLDYYLIYPDSPRAGRDLTPEGIVVEEFVLAEDYTATGLHSIGWRSSGRDWRASSALSRAIRVNGNLRDRVVGIGRQQAEALYRELGGGELPDEEALRAKFGDGPAFPAAAPLRLSPRQVPAGFHDARLYRVLFANELDRQGLTDLRADWSMADVCDIADPRARVIGTAHARVGEDTFSWDLRRVGGGAAWCLDVSANLAAGDDDNVGLVLRELITDVRRQGLIPVTIERLS
jgi:hypothetical protein